MDLVPASTWKATHLQVSQLNPAASKVKKAGTGSSFLTLEAA